MLQIWTIYLFIINQAQESLHKATTLRLYNLIKILIKL